MRQDKSYKIISNKCICDNYFELKVKADTAFLKKCSPGQFFMISVPGFFLRRPISIHDIKKDTISFLYKVVGEGTKSLSERKGIGDTIEMLGALGVGYDLKINQNSTPVIVAGGTGIASVYYLATQLKKKGVLYYGARNSKDLICLDKFKKLGWKVIVSTEDGSKGYKGFITDLLTVGANLCVCPNYKFYVCGPTPMIKAVLKIARDKNIDGFVSLEEKMACGVGNCQGCAVKIKGQNKMVCKNGPVFKMEDVDL